MVQKRYETNYKKGAETKYENLVLNELEKSSTKIDNKKGLENNIDGCSCMGCKCFKSAWTVVLSPAGVAAGMSAYATAAVL